MARHSAFEDSSAQDVQHATVESRAVLKVVMRAHLARGALGRAKHAADLLAAHDGQANGLALLIDMVLAMGDAQLARRALAENAAQILPDEDALIRARIAQAQGDLEAARAILVTAIEAMPDLAILRRALAEVMVATGTAADVRAVLAHLGTAQGATAPRAATLASGSSVAD